MEYVMVPVPAELADEVKAFLRWDLMMPKPPQDNPDALTGVVEELEPDMRRLVRHVAEQAIEGIRPSLPDIHEDLDLSPHQALGICHDLNRRSRLAGGPAAVIALRADPRPQPAGRTEFEHRILFMAEPVAKEIAAI